MPLGISLEKKAELIDSETLSHLRSYKYSSVDKSYISNYILRHYWNFCAELMPLWLAPNVITLIGLMFIYVNVLCIVIYVPDLVGPGPSWLYFSFAAGLWLYSTMDNIDGKQARRTGSSSPLGELFDHGIDSLNCTLGGLVETACMGLGPTGTGAFITMVSCLAMFFSTWETYHTHTLYLGHFNGPTEGIIIAVGLMIISGIFGPEIWQKTLEDILPVASLLPAHVGDTSLREIFVNIVALAFFTAHLPFCVYNVYKARQAQHEPFLPTLKEWIPYVWSVLSVYFWLDSPYSVVLYENHLVLFSLATSFSFGRVTTKIILAHLTKQPFPYWTILMVPVYIAPLLFNWLPSVGMTVFTGKFELLYLWAYAIFSFTYFMAWARVVINAICDYLGINCFTIKTPMKTN
ncbi:CDP-alcohol phosphatidyltransferase-domain-containing protein [Lipomyces tetrasporus]|uniref:CDP-alcohol phosphatidyltransferase-domain-containing protein n=1 Tax=Lipomyces tetrasporus TaxID=54092 RepID=A0AAD7QUS2_9ASCO|nr:CDP-alcohol phosphatidyltransferase-domain-containing protein [Lipomyces tetrasporus]KAJ8101878.1 CDP-alcohol phosphatidyltransferase-domain-containing protein [Lipomyces tetrasporus]